MRRISTEEEARQDATELGMIISECGLSREETVDLFTVVLLGAAGRASAVEVEKRVTKILGAAMRRQGAE